MWLSGLLCSGRCSSMTWGRARATRSLSLTWTSTLSRIWCAMSTVAGVKGSKKYLSYIGLLDCLWLQGEWPSWQIWPTSECCWQVWHQVCLLSLTVNLRVLINNHKDFAPFIWPVNVPPHQRLEGGMLSVIVNQPCCWPGHLQFHDLDLLLKSQLNCDGFLLYRWWTFWSSPTYTRLLSWKPQLYHFYLPTKRRSSANLTGKLSWRWFREAIM